MTDKRVQKLVLAALFAALCTIMTMVVQIPSPMGGYLNLGDCAVLLAGWILGPLYGAAAAGIGSMLADLLGYPLYAPGTLVIKALMAAAAALLLRLLSRDGAFHLQALIISAVVGEVIMVVGYFLFEALSIPLFIGLGMGALANIHFNVIQGVFGLVSAAAIYTVLSRSRALTRL